MHFIVVTIVSWGVFGVIALAVKCSHNPCGVDQVCVGGRFAWPRKLCGSGSCPALVLDPLHLDLVAIVAYLEL